jgi:hypothetical protein
MSQQTSSTNIDTNQTICKSNELHFLEMLVVTQLGKKLPLLENLTAR